MSVNCAVIIAQTGREVNIAFHGIATSCKYIHNNYQTYLATNLKSEIRFFVLRQNVHHDHAPSNRVHDHDRSTSRSRKVFV